jgi:glutamate/tyrosine decarboxylase-like PLP-dependent enzyme
MEDADYITMIPTVHHNRALVVIMHFNKATDSWEQKKCSDALSQRAAEALAASWAAATGLEVR